MRRRRRPARVAAGAPGLGKAIAKAEQLYAAYKSSGLALEEFEGPRYQRIAHIAKLLSEGVLGNSLRHTASQPESAVA